ncbi:MAG: hypothetical protein WDZ54_07700 [Sneathiella sp.]
MTSQTPNSGPKLMSPDALTNMILRLSEILEQENLLLRDHDPEGFKATLNEKTRLVAIYNQQMTLIKNNPEAYRAFPKKDIDRLKQTSEEFYATLDQHFRRLSTARTVTEGMVRSVADEIAKKKAPPSAYTSKASVSDPLSNRNTRAINGAIAINQVI